MADAVVGDVVEGDLDDELGAQDDPLQRVVRAPARRLARATLPGLVRGEGLHEPDGTLRTVGHTSGFNAREKRELPARLAAYETGNRGMGDPSRWASDRELEWIELRPELVVEVTFDHTSNGRIRHGAKIARWREDKVPRECGLEQLAM